MRFNRKRHVPCDMIFLFGNQFISYCNILFVAKRNSPGQISSITKLKGHQITEKEKENMWGLNELNSDT